MGEPSGQGVGNGLTCLLGQLGPCRDEPTEGTLQPGGDGGPWSLLPFLVVPPRVSSTRFLSVCSTVLGPSSQPLCWAPPVNPEILATPASAQQRMQGQALSWGEWLVMQL